MEKLAPVTKQHKSLTELTYQMIRDKIISGEYQPGDWLRQEQLAQQLEVSYTPIRQALDWLVADGLAEHVSHKGVRLTLINEKEIAEAYSLRLLLDPILARVAAENRSTADIKHLQDILEQLEKTTTLDDMRDRRRLNREYHKTISESAVFKTLERLSEIVWNRFPDWMFYEGLYKEPDTITKRFARENKEHREILESIINQNAQLAKDLSIDHIRAFMKDDLMEVFNIPGEVLDEMEKQMGLGQLK
ncbi:GntR family transcriptional regulator [bacterium]|jgi:DNA-binding GntR family transcriptional regulator|nr:GntR family transcriptional regulator [bacterium]